jgi:hypothetical protein
MWMEGRGTTVTGGWECYRVPAGEGGVLEDALRKLLVKLVVRREHPDF